MRRCATARSTSPSTVVERIHVEGWRQAPEFFEVGRRIGASLPNDVGDLRLRVLAALSGCNRHQRRGRNEENSTFDARHQVADSVEPAHQGDPNAIAVHQACSRHVDPRLPREVSSTARRKSSAVTSTSMSSPRAGRTAGRSPAGASGLSRSGWVRRAMRRRTRTTRAPAARATSAVGSAWGGPSWAGRRSPRRCPCRRPAGRCRARDHPTRVRERTTPSGRCPSPP